jgi:hypothetical protein
MRGLPCVAILVLLICGRALAGDPVAGMALYNNVPDSVISCGIASCHGPNPNDNVNGLQQAGNNPGVILNAIRMGVTQMMFLNGLLNPFQLDDIAAYLAPQPALSADLLDFGVVATGAIRATQGVTVQNPGGVDLGITSITLSGPHASDFAIGGSCVAGATLASTTIERPGGSCDIVVTFAPSASGARSAVVTLRYPGTTTFPATQTIALNGAGDVAAIPQASLSTLAIDFGEQSLNQASAERVLTIGNPGTAPLIVTYLAVFGPQAADFAAGGSCVADPLPLVIAPLSTCDLRVEFMPLGSDLRNAAIRIRHNAAGSPGTVSLSGVGVAPTCQPPAPPAETRTIACAAGQEGTMTQSRSYACDATTWIPGPWLTVASDCRATLPAADLALAEYVNTQLNHYFVTADPHERASVESGGAGPGWSATGVPLGRVWQTPAAAAIVPVCRFYGNPAPGPAGQRLGPNSHFYTADADECAAVKRDAGWIFEGIVFHVVAASFGSCPAPLVPVYRLYNRRFAQNDTNHRYTIEPLVVAQMTQLGWAAEGVVFCIAPD